MYLPRNRYFVCYDVRDPVRLVATYKKMCGYGDHVQYSVFSCPLSAKELVYMKTDLEKILNLNEDRVLVIDTGPTDGRSDRVFVMGTQTIPEEGGAVIV